MTILFRADIPACADFGVRLSVLFLIILTNPCDTHDEFSTFSSIVDYDLYSWECTQLARM
jgi:hypothetical protein